ncbi:MAG: cell division protein FtsL [Candidatus Aminicenantes bacterium]|nr:MAG: cell division protein FtsL [Candidatus Aminicenantes bacterium]
MVRKKFSKKEIFIGISCTLFALLILSLYVWHQTESVNLGYDSAELEYRVLQLEKEVEELETVKSSLLTLDRVEDIARDKLKLSEPEEEQIVYKDIEKRH